MLILILIVFFICLLFGYLSICYNISNWEKRTFVFVIYTLLVVSAGFRSSQYLDYINYLQGFNTGVENFEITFDIIRSIAKSLSLRNYHWLFLIYALLGVLAKFIAIKKLSPLFFYSVAIYVSYFFVLHELIQIRAGVASAICLLSIKYIYKKKIIPFVVLISIATFFHSSAILYFPLYFLGVEKFTKMKWLCVFISLTVLFGIISPNIDVLASLLPTERIQTKILAYEESASKGHIEEVSLFSLFNIFCYLLLLVFVFFAKKLQSHNKYFYVLLKIYIIGILFNIMFYNWIPTLAIRGFEMYTIVSIILVPMLYHITRNRFMGTLVVALIGFSYIAIIFFRGYIPQ